MMIESIAPAPFRNYDDEMIRFPRPSSSSMGRMARARRIYWNHYIWGASTSRGIADADLISWNQDQASIIIQFQRSDTQQQLKIILSRTAKKELWVNETKVPQRKGWSGPSTKSCSRRTTCSSSRAARRCGAVSSTWKSPRSVSLFTGTAVQPGHFPAQSPAEEDEI